jgi:hypothetical protein
MRHKAVYNLLDRRRNEGILEELKLDPLWKNGTIYAEIFKLR